MLSKLHRSCTLATNTVRVDNQTNISFDVPAVNCHSTALSNKALSNDNKEHSHNNCNTTTHPSITHTVPKPHHTRRISKLTEKMKDHLITCYIAALKSHSPHILSEVDIQRET